MSLVQMSLAGSVVALAGLIIRITCIHRVGKGFLVAVWCVAVAKLLLPFSLAGLLGIHSLSGQPGAARTIDFLRGQGVLGAAVNAGYFKALWGLGVVLMVVYFCIAYLRVRQVFAHSNPAEQVTQPYARRRGCTIRVSDKVDTAYSFGIFHQVILLPVGLLEAPKETIEYVVLHERMHGRHFDAVKKWCMVAALCLHWFNPAVWVLYFLFNRDMELHCDESVVKRLEKKQRAGYIKTLLQMETSRAGGLPVVNGFSKYPVEERVVCMLRYKKSRVVNKIVVGIMLGLFAFVGTSGSPVQAKETTIPEVPNLVGYTMGEAEEILVSLGFRLVALEE